MCVNIEIPSFVFSKWADDPKSFEVLALLVLLTSLAIILPLLCEPGAMLTEKFDGLSDELSQCNWFTLSTKMQRMYVLFLSDTQNEIKLMSFAGITCERETLKKVAVSHVQIYTIQKLQSSLLFPFSDHQ